MSEHIRILPSNYKCSAKPRIISNKRNRNKRNKEKAARSIIVIFLRRARNKAHRNETKLDNLRKPEAFRFTRMDCVTLFSAMTIGRRFALRRKKEGRNLASCKVKHSCNTKGHKVSGGCQGYDGILITPNRFIDFRNSINIIGGGIVMYIL